MSNKDCKHVIPELRDLAIFLAHAHMEWHELRYKALNLEEEECRDFLLMQFPTIQGTSNLINMEKVGKLQYEPQNVGKAVRWLLEQRQAVETGG